MRFFRYDSSFWPAMERIFDWMLLNLLWLVTSLPLLTIGASTAALTDVTRQMVRGEGPAILKSFFQAWGRSWKKASALWGLLAAAAAWLCLSIRICLGAGEALFLPVAVMEGSLLLVVLLSAPYLFAFCVERDQSLTRIVKAAVFSALKHLPWSVLLAALVLVPAAATLLVWQALPWLFSFWLFLGVGSIAFLQRKIFDRLERTAGPGPLEA